MICDKLWIYIGERVVADGDHLLWTGTLDMEGYAQGSVGGKTFRIGRLILAEKMGREIPPEMDTCHVVGCRYKNCIAPDHLYEGTKTQNQADRVSDGTASRGEAHALSRLTDADVLAIRADARPSSVLAAEHGVSLQQIWRIKRGLAWSHISCESVKSIIPVQRGEAVSHAKLTESDVIAIRADSRSQRAIAKEHGVCQTVISKIISRKTWAHIPETDDQE